MQRGVSNVDKESKVVPNCQHKQLSVGGATEKYRVSYAIGGMLRKLLQADTHPVGTTP